MNTPPPWLGISTGDWLINSNTPHMDAIESSTDPLTGALNRRGLHLNIGDLLNQFRFTRVIEGVLIPRIH